MNNLMNDGARRMIDQADGARSCPWRKRPCFTVTWATLLFWAPRLIWAANPSVSFTSTPLPITDQQTSQPFSGIQISDPDSNDTVTVDITFPDIRGAFPTNSSFTKQAPGFYRLASQSPSNAQTAVRTLVFTPTANRIPLGTNEITTFTVMATDSTSGVGSNTVNLTVSPGNDPPNVSFGSSPASINDKQTSQPFSGIQISDPDSNDTVTVDITFPDIRGAFPTNSSFTKQAPGFYRLASQSPSNAQTTLRALVFTPVGDRIPIGTNEMTTFTVTATDMASASNAASVNLTVTPVNDAPAITGLVVTQIYDNADSPIFLAMTVTDVDNRGAQPVTARVSIISTKADKLVVGGVLTTSYETNGTPSNVTAALHDILVRPAPHTVPPQFTNTFQVALNVIDGGGMNSPDNRTNTVVNVEAANTLPVVMASVYPSNILDSAGVVTPFSLSIVDPDIGEQFAVNLTPLSGSEVYGTLDQPTSFTGSYFSVQTSVAGIRYHPNNVASNQIVRFQFKVTEMLVSNSVITNLFLSEMTTNVQLTILGGNDSPEIAGVEEYALRTTDDPAAPPILPFPGVMIIDPDVRQSVTVTLSVLDPAIGTLSNAWTGAVGPSLTLSGTTTQITEAIRCTTFSANQIPGRVIGSSVSVQLRIEVFDGIAGTVRNDDTEVVVTAVNGAPRIDRVDGFPNAAHPVRISPFPPVSPFAGVTIADDDSNLTVTISIDNPAKGSLLLKDIALSNLVGFAEQSPSSGVYRLAGSPSNLTVAVTSLEFRISGTYIFPPSAPGGATFTIQAVDPVLNQTTRMLPITVQNEPRNWLVTKTDDDGSKGTLRYAVTNAGNDDVITFALPKYPALIRLDWNFGAIDLSRNTTLKGPGANMLTISGDTDGNGDPDTQLFRVNAWVTMEGLTLSRGLAASGTNLTGGAIYVGKSGRLTLRFCAVTDSRATQWGGGIDVDQGKLDMENCLVRGNSTSEAGGLGGGAISLYTGEACSFVNTTFSSNRQLSASGYGGGAIYVENYTPSIQLPVGIIHCTFAENDDAASNGSSIQANVFNTYVAVRNSIFADGRGQNLAVEGAAEIVSEGGNLSDDSTRVFLMQGGVPEEVILLNATHDVRSVNIATMLRLPFDEWVRPSGVYRLAVLSPAIANAVAPVEAVDQRGVIRGGTPDSGAFQNEASARLTLNEFSMDAPSFLEVYVPRDSMAVNLAGYTLWVNGVCRHIFVEPAVIQPGFGIVVADTHGTLSLVGSTNNPTLVVKPSITNLTLSARGQMELRLPDGRAVNRITYVGVYAETVSNDYNFSGDSLTLAPQFVGYAYLPHRIVLPPLLGGADLTMTGGSSSPGGDTGHTPFGSPNAYPLAQPDAVVVSEDERALVPVLNNDLDADGLDQLVITDVSTWTGEAGNDVQAFSQEGALVSIIPSVTNPAVNPMIQGDSVEYNPLDAPDIQSLTPGEKLTDTFFYEILDVGTGNITNYAAGASVVISSPAHRLTNGVQIAISGAAVTHYNGTCTVTVVDDDRFSLNGVAYAGNTEPRGSWRMLNARNPSVRSEGEATLTVVGVNDPPAPADDTVLNVTEDTVTRIMGMPDLAGSTTAVFTTDNDYPMIPTIAMESLSAE